MPARNCKQLYNDGFRASGLYSIVPQAVIAGTATRAMVVYCDMSLQGGGWTVIQRRVDHSLDFNRNWVSYKMGFGNLEGNFWLGLDSIMLLTNDVNMELYVGISCIKCTDGAAYARYSQFSVAQESQNYQLKLSGYSPSSTVGDSLSVHSGKKFSTFDKDNDGTERRNCAQDFNSGWWFDACYRNGANLNGVYQTQATSIDPYGIQWSSYGTNEVLHLVVMAVRPAS